MKQVPGCSHSSAGSHNMSLRSQASITTAYHPGCSVWVPERKPSTTPSAAQKAAEWSRGKVLSISRAPDGASLLQVGVQLVACWGCMLLCCLNAGQPLTLCLAVQIQKEDGSTVALSSADCPLQNERDDTVDDLVKSDFLHEPG